MTVEERLTRLEKSLKRWRLTTNVLGLVCALLAGGLAWEHLGTKGTIRARNIYVVNEKGNAIELTTSNEGDGLISVNDQLSLARVMLGTSQKGFGKLELYTGSQQRLATFGGTGSGGQVAIFNNAGHKVVDLQAKKTNSGAIVVNDFEGRFVNGLEGDSRATRQGETNWR